MYMYPMHSTRGTPSKSTTVISDPTTHAATALSRTSQSVSQGLKPRGKLRILFDLA